MSLIQQNSTDPLTGLRVKNIYVKKVSRKTGKEIWHQKWQYYRHRKTLSIVDFYKETRGKTIRITFSGRPQPKVMELPDTIEEVEEMIKSAINNSENDNNAEN